MTILCLYQQQLIAAMYTLTMIQIMKNLMMAQNCSLSCNFSNELLMLNIGHQHHHVIAFMCGAASKTSHTQSAREVSPLLSANPVGKNLLPWKEQLIQIAFLFIHSRTSFPQPLTPSNEQRRAGWREDRRRIGWVGGGGGWQKIDVSVDFAEENKGARYSEA